MSRRKKKSNGIARAINREDGDFPFWPWGKPPKRICVECKFVAQATTCPRCSTEMVVMDRFKRARPPRKRASKRKWEAFYDRFGIGIR